MILMNSMGRFCILSYMTHGNKNFPYEYVQCGRVYFITSSGITFYEDASEWKCFCIPR